MTYTDYVNWTNEYRREIEVLNEKIKKKNERNYFETVKEKQVHEQTTQILRSMLSSCYDSLRSLERTKNSIKQREEKNGTDIELIQGA